VDVTKPSVVLFADCELDLSAFELRREGALRPIEPQVFELLVYLIRNSDRLVTKDELIEKLWAGRAVSDAALSSRIKSARKAIGDDGEQQKLIRTVHGRGVRFVGQVSWRSAPAASSVEQDSSGRLRNHPVAAAQEIRFCITSDQVRIAYAVGGNGPPLVKPANWMTHLEYDWESPIWRHWIRELSRDHTLIRYDERANGLSDWNAQDVSLDGLVRDLEAVVDAAGLDTFPMLCISQGCSIAISYAVRNPGRVSRLVLYGGYARGWAMRGNPVEIAQRHALSTLIEHGWGKDNPAFRQIFTSLFLPGGSAEQMQWFNDLQRTTTSAENAARLHETFGGVDVRYLLAAIDVPTLVLHGRNDAVIPFEEGRILASGIPNARFVSLDSANHILLEAEPAWPRFLAEVRAFLDDDAAKDG
jgi:pimeloyl-ACP methyl ester carboxylesterase/DNA-binding winged helix-turn-helix (wHTH) protein